MSTGLLFITSPTADFKAANRLLLYLRDWEYGAGDCFKLITTKDAIPELNPNDATVPPISDSGFSASSNAWASASVDEVCAFVRTKAQESEGSLCVIVDQAGFTKKEAIVAEVQSNDDDDEESGEDDDDDDDGDDGDEKTTVKWNKVRVPWEPTYTVWCNLAISNVDFYDYVVDEDEGGDENGWFQWDPETVDPLDDNSKTERDGTILEFERNGQA